ncbi:MAG: hypothetical protein HYT94_03425 [Parcubacteria group bacterium]|nr:hypothetical protein [Parcubacteria group bacterium]
MRGSAAAPTNKFDAPRKGQITGTRNRAEAIFTCTSPGAATIAYTADIAWARGGGEPPADKCDAEHWHANMGTARSILGYMWSDPSGCGFGKTSEVQAGKVKLSPDQAAPYIENVPGRR